MFILTILASALALNLVSSMETVNNQSTLISQNWLPSVQTTSMLNTATSDFRLAQCKHLGTTDPATMNEAEQDMAALSKHIEKLRRTYEPLISSTEEKALYEQFSKEWAKYIKDHEEFLTLSRNNQNDEANKILYGDSLKQFNAASEHLIKLVELNANGSRDASATGDMIYAHQKQIAIAGIVILLGL